MTDIDQTVELKQRSVLGKGLGGLRQAGLVPGVIHDHGQPSIHVEASEAELGRIYKVAGKHHPLQLKVGDKEYLALIKDAHFNPVKRRLQHVVFQAIKQDEAVEAEIPIHLEGEIPAEKAGLMVLRQLDNVQIEALPKNLPNELSVDATKLVELHDKITVADIVVPTGVTILTEAEHPIAMVVETRAQVSEADEVAEDEAAEGAEASSESSEGESEAKSDDQKSSES